MGRPLGVSIIAVILLISGLLNVLLGLVGMDLIRVDLGSPAAGSQASGAGLLVGGVLTLVVAAGMFGTAGWAWWLTVIVMIFRIIVDGLAVISYGLSSTIGYSAVVDLIISAFILWYFNRANVKTAFGR